MPDYMVMGERDVADMTEMSMPLPDTTLPMMLGEGPHGSVEMGVVVSILKVRKNIPHGAYVDLGWYTHPQGHQAYGYTGELPETAKQFSPSNNLLEPTTSPVVSRYQAVKPNFHKG